MKPFNASEFISNQETPVVSRHGGPVHIITTKGRGLKPVLGYLGENETVEKWGKFGMMDLTGELNKFDLFFAPKIEVVHVFRCISEKCIVSAMNKDAKDAFMLYPSNYTYLGTITGPIVPPEEGK